MRFKGRSHLHNKVKHVEATTSYSKDLANIINEGGYTKQKILSVEETALSKTFTAKEKPKPGFTISKDRLTLVR